MRRLATFGCAAICVAVASIGGSAHASFLINGLVNGSNPLPIPGNQSWGGQLGDDFVTTSDLLLTQVAVFDDNGNGTSKALTWQIFRVSDGFPVAQYVIPASGARTPGSTVLDNYVFLPIAPLLLTANTAYSVVAYGFDSNNQNFNTNINPSTTDIIFSNVGLNAAGGRYSNPGSFVTLPSIGAGNVVSAQPYNFGAAAFEYTAVPEASSVLVMLVGGIFAFGAASLGKRYGISVKVQL